MGAYTWTFVRIDKLTKEQVKSCVGHAVWLNSGSNTYSKYSTMSEEEYVNDWIKFHKEEYDYFVNECGVLPEKMTDEYLEKQIKKKMKHWFYTQKCYQKCLDGTMTVEDMLRKTHQLRGYNDFYIIKRKGHYYIQIEHEIFRNYEYCEEEFNTVESLIKHLEDPNLKNIKDISGLKDENVQPEYGPLSEALKKKIIDYYTAIGDGNFIVHFG